MRLHTRPSALLAAVGTALLVVAPAPPARAAVPPAGPPAPTIPTLRPAPPAPPRPPAPRLPPVLYRVATHAKVVFLTVDDGTYRLDATRRLLESTPSVVFPAGTMVSADPAYWRSLSAAGVPVENHTWSHPYMGSWTQAAQEQQICKEQRVVRAKVGVTPYLFRPPGGSWNAATQRAARACGLRYVVLWDVTAQGGKIATWGGPIKAGDIILMHFTRSFPADLALVKARVARAGLRFARLTDYLR